AAGGNPDPVEPPRLRSHDDDAVVAGQKRHRIAVHLPPGDLDAIAIEYAERRPQGRPQRKPESVRIGRADVMPTAEFGPLGEPGLERIIGKREPDDVEAEIDPLLLHLADDSFGIATAGLLAIGHENDGPGADGPGQIALHPGERI